MDFWVIIAFRDSKLAYATEFFIYLESNAVFQHNFWRPQPTLPYFRLQYSISKKTRTTASLSSMQGVFAESSLRKQTWRNHKEGRVVCLHQNIFTRKVTHLPPTFAIILHIPHPLRPCFWRPRVPVPHVLASHTWCPQVPRLASPSPKSPHTRPDVPVPLLYTAKQMSESLNLLSNRIYLFKVNLLVHSAGRWLDQRSRRMLAVISLLS